MRLAASLLDLVLITPHGFLFTAHCLPFPAHCFPLTAHSTLTSGIGTTKRPSQVSDVTHLAHDLVFEVPRVE